MRPLLRALRSESGIGIIEVLVAMLMLALLAVAFLPVLITGLKLSAANSSSGTATQLVSSQLALARAQSPTCAALLSFAGGSGTSVVDGNGKTLVPTRTLGSCPSSYPGTVTFTASVAASGTTTTIATATTLIYVGANS